MGREVDGERGPTFVDTNAHEDTARQKTRQSPVIGLRFYYTLAHAGVLFPRSSSSLPAFPFFLLFPSPSPSIFISAEVPPLCVRFCFSGPRRVLRPRLRPRGPTPTPRQQKLHSFGAKGAEALRCRGKKKKKEERKKEQNNEYVFP